MVGSFWWPLRGAALGAPFWEHPRSRVLPQGRSTWEHPTKVLPQRPEHLGAHNPHLVAPTKIPPKSPFWKHPRFKPSGPTWEHLGAPRPNLGAPRSARVHHRAPGRHMFTLGAPSCPSAQILFYFPTLWANLWRMSQLWAARMSPGEKGNQPKMQLF